MTPELGVRREERPEQPQGEPCAATEDPSASPSVSAGGLAHQARVD